VSGSSGSIEELIAAIAQLPPEQRRQLQRRLHAAGLFVAEDLLTDQNRLGVAIAVRDSKAPGAVQARQRSLFADAFAEIEKAERSKPAAAKAGEANPAASKPAASKSAASKSAASETAPPSGPADARPRPSTSPPASTREAATPKPVGPRAASAPAPGRVVIGAPQRGDSAPHAMTPLPGQAPEAPIAIVFDGGSKGNPGEGYGSYQLRWPGAQPQLVRLQFGSNYTNNEAEYDTLIRALEDVHRRLQQLEADPGSARVEIRGDSQLVIRQVLGEWKCKDARMAQRRDQVRKLLTPLGGWSLTWHDRSNSVRDLGH
jgi:ribonuclease HI